MSKYRSAKEFIAAVMERYRTLQVYSDQGHVIIRRAGHEEFRCIFQTALGAGGDFRFAFQRPHPYWPMRHKISRHVVGRSKGQAYLASTYYRKATTVDVWPDFALPIAAATGISMGSAHRIGQLLFPEIGGRSLADLGRPRLRSPKWVDGALCYRVNGLEGNKRVTIFVGMHDLLIRKFAARNGHNEEIRQALDLHTVHPATHFEMPKASA